MKKRIAALLLLTMSVSLMGCNKVYSPDTIETEVQTQEISVDTETAVDASTADVAEASEEVIQEQPSEDASAVSGLDTVYANRYSVNSNAFVSGDEAFYKNFNLAVADAHLDFNGGDRTIDRATAIWGEKTDAALQRIKDSGEIDGNQDQLAAVEEAWKKYSEDIVKVDNGLYGFNGVVPGSMYKDMVADYALSEYEFFGGAFLSWEYEVLKNNELKLNFLDETSDVSSVNWREFEITDAAMESDQDFLNMIQEYDLDNADDKKLLDISKELCSKLDELSGNTLGFESAVDDYYELVNAMEAFETAISGEETAAAVKATRMKYMVLKLAGAKFLMDI